MFLPRTRSARFPRRARARGPPGGWGSARRPSGACWRCPGRSTQQGTNSRLKADSATGNAPRMRARNWDAAAHLQLAEVPGGHGVSRPGLGLARSRSRRRVPPSETKQSSRKRRKPAALARSQRACCPGLAQRFPVAEGGLRTCGSAAIAVGRRALRRRRRHSALLTLEISLSLGRRGSGKIFKGSPAPGVMIQVGSHLIAFQSSFRPHPHNPDAGARHPPPAPPSGSTDHSHLWTS